MARPSIADERSLVFCAMYTATENVSYRALLESKSASTYGWVSETFTEAHGLRAAYLLKQLILRHK